MADGVAVAPMGKRFWNMAPSGKERAAVIIEVGTLLEPIWPSFARLVKLVKNVPGRYGRVMGTHT